MKPPVSLLDFAEQQQLIDPVLGSFDVSVHQRGGAANAAAMRGADDLLPLLGGEFVARKHEADVVVENLGGRSRQSVEAIVAQHAQIIFERHAGEFDAVDDLHGRESVNVHAGYGLLYRAQNVAIVERRQAVRQAALNADFGGADFPGFDGLLRDLLEAEEVGVGFARAAAEGAELAADEADIGEIDIAIDDVGDDIAGQLATQGIGGDQQAEQVVAFGVCQQQALFAREHAAIQRFHHLLERAARLDD